MSDIQSRAGVKSNRLQRLATALSSLDSRSVYASYFTRNLSLRVLIVAYIVDRLFFSSPYIDGVMAFSLSAIVVTQLYLVLKFWRDAKINSIQEWVFLFNQQYWALKIMGLVILLIVAVPIVLNPSLLSLNIVGLTLLFALLHLSSVTDVLLKPLVRNKMTGLVSSPEEVVMGDDEESDAERKAKYRQIALSVLNSDTKRRGVNTERVSQEVGGSQSVATKEEVYSAFPSVRESERTLQELWVSAYEKIEELDDPSSGPNDAALSAGELKVLSDAEVEALLLRERFGLEKSEEPFQKTKRQVRGR